MTRHSLDATSLICGIVLAAVAVAYLIGENSTFDVDMRWALPLTLIGLGAGGLVGAVASTRRANASVAVPAEQSESAESS